MTWSGLTHWERHYYDGLHREYRRESLADDGTSTIVVTWAYDTRDNVVTATLAAFDGAPAATIVRTYIPIAGLPAGRTARRKWYDDHHDDVSDRAA